MSDTVARTDDREGYRAYYNIETWQDFTLYCTPEGTILLDDMRYILCSVGIDVGRFMDTYIELEDWPA